MQNQPEVDTEGFPDYPHTPKSKAMDPVALERAIAGFPEHPCTPDIGIEGSPDHPCSESKQQTLWRSREA